MISFLEILKVALRALTTNKTRSFLTTLGIIIGVAAVIAAFAVGQGANRQIDAQISSLGSNFLYVFQDRSASAFASTRYLTDADAEAIKNECSGVVAVAPSVGTTTQVIFGNLNWNTEVDGSTADYSVVFDQQIEQGRDILPSDVRSGAKVCVLGKTVSDKLFEGDNPIGEIVRIKGIPFTVIGTYRSKGRAMGGWDQDDFVMTPITTAQRRLVRRNPGQVNNIAVKGVSMAALDYIEVQINDLLKERHRIRDGQPLDFAVRNISQMLETRRKATATMMLLLACIAVISLVVGGIGIMNIMLVSVTERTREIGIRMAVGAKTGDIRMQFLIEAVTLSLIGGTIGIGVGVGAGYGLAKFMQAPPVFSVSSIVLAFVFSAFVGVGFGFYPAWKASLLNPIDALKYE